MLNEFFRIGSNGISQFHSDEKRRKNAIAFENDDDDDNQTNIHLHTIRVYHKAKSLLKNRMWFKNASCRQLAVKRVGAVK